MEGVTTLEEDENERIGKTEVVWTFYCEDVRGGCWTGGHLVDEDKAVHGTRLMDCDEEMTGRGLNKGDCEDGTL